MVQLEINCLNSTENYYKIHMFFPVLCCSLFPVSNVFKYSNDSPPIALTVNQNQNQNQSQQSATVDGWTDLAFVYLLCKLIWLERAVSRGG